MVPDQESKQPADYENYQSQAPDRAHSLTKTRTRFQAKTTKVNRDGPAGRRKEFTRPRSGITLSPPDISSLYTRICI